MKYKIGQLVKLTAPSEEYCYMWGAVGCVFDSGIVDDDIEQPNYVVEFPEYASDDAWLCEEFRLSPIDDSDNRTESVDELVFNPAKEKL